MDGGLGLDLGREREEFRPGTVMPAVRRHCRRRGGLGRARLGARVHQTEIRAHRGTRGRKGVSAKPLRRPRTAASAVAAMAGDHSSRSSRPGLEKPRNEKRKAWEERGEYGDAHHGEKSERRRLGDGGSRGGGRRNPATSERRLLGPSVRERGRNWSGERERDAREGSALLNRGRGVGDAPTMREERARLRLDRRCGCGSRGRKVGGRADQRARLAAAESEGGAPVGLARLAGPSGRGARRLR